jgi:hypothetical protein
MSVVKVNGAAVPASKSFVGTNSSSQIIDASATVVATAQLPVNTFFSTISTASNSTQNQNTFPQNDVMINPFYLPAGNYTFSALELSFSAIDNSSNSYDFGIYGGTAAGSNDCESGNTTPRVAHTGTVAGSALPSPAAAGMKTIALTGAPVTGIAGGGWYCIAVTSSGPTPLVRLAGTSGLFLDAPWGGAEATAVTGGGATLPTSITAPSNAATRIVVAQEFIGLH